MTLNRGGYGLHQSIWRLFPGSETAQKRDFIYHVIKREEIPAFYVVSKRVPEDPEGIWEVETKTYSPKIIEGLKLGFSMRANPRVTKKTLHQMLKILQSMIFLWMLNRIIKIIIVVKLQKEQIGKI